VLFFCAPLIQKILLWYGAERKRGEENFEIYGLDKRFKAILDPQHRLIGQNDHGFLPGTRQKLFFICPPPCIRKLTILCY